MLIKSAELIPNMPDFTEPTVGNVMKVFEVQKAFENIPKSTKSTRNNDISKVFSE